jgi:hypothetical protein
MYTQRWKYLFGGNSFGYLYDKTAIDPLPYAGEWCQILYNDFGILSVDIELPSGYNEGYRNDKARGEYNPDLVKNDDFNNGVLMVEDRSFYKLLETYSVEIDKYISSHRKG